MRFRNNHISHNFMNVFPFLTALLVLGAFPLHGQDTAGRELTLDESIRLGLLHNIDVMRSASDLQRSQTYKQSAFGDFLPSLSAGAGWTRYDRDQIVFRNDNYIVSRDSWDFNARANLTVFDGLRNFQTAEKSIVDVKAAEQSFTRRREDIVFNIQYNFYNVLRLQRFVIINETNLGRSHKQLERIRELNAVGSIPQADVFRQEVVVKNDELALLESQNNYQNALLDYQAYLGVTPVRDCTLDPGDVSSTFTREEILGYRSGLPGFKTMVEEALKHRGDYRQNELLLQSADHGIAIARSGYYPSINAFASYGWNNVELNFKEFSDYDRFFYGLSLSVPIFSNFNVSTAVERSEISRKDSEDGLRQLRRTITSDIMKALNNLEASEKNIDIAQSKQQSAREDLRTATERYELGAGTLLDQIVANANMTAAESDVINAAFNYLTARRQLEYQLGKLDF